LSAFDDIEITTIEFGGRGTGGSIDQAFMGK
jgi:hypothetical protein